MPPIAVMTAIGLALLSGPSAFLFLWLTYKRTREASLRSLAFSMLGLVLVLMGNATEYLSVVLHRWDARVSFLILNEAFLSTVMTGAFLARFAHESTRTALTKRRRTTFWASSVAFFFLVISLALFLHGPYAVDVSKGYLATTIFGAICQLYATLVIIRNRKGLPAVYRIMPAFMAVLMVLGVVAVMNDVFHFGALLHGPEFPFSPVFFFLVNVSIIFVCLKFLLGTREGTPAAGAIPDFALSDRESEIVPLIVEGLSNDDIASRLFISPHTVKNHVTSIFRKAASDRGPCKSCSSVTSFNIFPFAKCIARSTIVLWSCSTCSCIVGRIVFLYAPPIKTVRAYPSTLSMCLISSCGVLDFGPIRNDSKPAGA